MKNNLIFNGVENIGIVCIDGTYLSPVAATLFNDMAVKSKNSNVRNVKFWDAGYQRGNQVSNSAKGFLQTRGFGTTEFMEPHRVDKYWIKSKDLIFTMDRFIKRDLIYDFPITGFNLKEKIFTLPEAAGIDKRIRDPGKDPLANTKKIYELIETCCQKIIQKMEKKM